MTAIATQLGTLSTAIAASNLVTDIHAGATDEDILKLITVLEWDLITLDNSSSAISTTTCVASKRPHVAERLASVLRIAAEKGYMVG